MLSFQSPTWYLLLCALLAGAYAGILYYKDTTFKEKPRSFTYILAAIRFLAVFLIASLLMSPMLKTLITDVKKPIVVMAQDGSESLKGVIRDTPQYKQNLMALQQALGEGYEVLPYTFGAEVREGWDFSFKDKLTNVSDLVKNIDDIYGNQNLSALVLATDGIYNEGSNPIYAAAKMKVPIYTIALGDTTPRKDLVVKKVFHNNIVYLGDKFTIQVDISANNCQNSNTTLSVAKVAPNGSVATIGAATTVVNINKSDFFFSKEIILDATEVGVQHYRITAAGVGGEMTQNNNVKDIYVEVLDGRTKILIAANAPHPDLAALNEALSGNKNYKVTVAYANDPKLNPNDFDFAILHQLPALNNGAEALLNALNNKKTPRLYIVGSQSDVRKLNTLQNLVAINTDGKSTTDVQAFINPNFNLFTLEDEYTQIAQFNALSAPFGDFKEAGGQVLLYQKIGKVDTKYPLISLGETNGLRQGLIAAEGLWKWRLFDFAQRQNHVLFDGFLGKILQYLSVKEDKRRFRVRIEKNMFRENEAVQLAAELYNNSYERINAPDVRLILTNSSGKQFNYTFNKEGNAYGLNLGVLPVGNYTYTASTNANGQDMSVNGQFSVQEIQLELYETTADHAVLRQLSQGSGGTLVYPNNIAVLADSIKAKANNKALMFSSYKTQNILNFKWLFFLIMGLLSVEWFARRYWGAY